MLIRQRQYGVYLAPSQYEAMFISDAIDNRVVDPILEASHKALKGI